MLTESSRYLFSHNPKINLYRYVSVHDHVTEGFRSKLASGRYAVHAFPCPVCGNKEDWLVVASTTEGFVWSICRSCGLLQNNVRLSQENLHEWYESGEYYNMCAHPGTISREEHFRWNYEASSILHLSFFEQIGVDLKTVRVLDIGCGAGSTILALKDRGATVKGFDLDREKVEFGKKYVPEIEHGNAFELAGDFSKFNYITLFGVLEHLFDPREFLTELRNRIGSETRVVLFVPNLETCNSFGTSFGDFLHMAHIWYFNSLNFERLLNTVGFELEYLLPSQTDMAAVCRKVDKPIPNTTNSFMLSVSAINRCNFDKDPNNAAIRSRRRRDQIIESIHHRAASPPRKLARWLKRRALRKLGYAILKASGAQVPPGAS